MAIRKNLDQDYCDTFVCLTPEDNENIRRVLTFANGAFSLSLYLSYSQVYHYKGTTVQLFNSHAGADTFGIVSIYGAKEKRAGVAGDFGFPKEDLSDKVADVHRNFSDYYRLRGVSLK